MLFDDGGVGEDVLNLRNAGVELTLFVFRLIVLAILRQVAEGAGFFNHFRDFFFAGSVQIIQLILQSLQMALAQLKFFCHNADTAFPLPQAENCGHLLTL